MTYTPFPVEQFGGLNVADDPQSVGPQAATDLLNVEFDKLGRLRSRDGSSILSTSATGFSILGGSYYKTAAAGEFMVVVDQTTAYPFDLSTGVVAATANPIHGNVGNNALARYGDPTNTRLYVTGNGLYRFNGAAWTGPIAGVNAPADMVTVSSDQRLVVAEIGLGCKVGWSDAGLPETYTANNFVRLDPGDGERITALIRWRELLLAFKRTKFYVFTSPSIDSTGNPIFNFRPVDAGQGASPGAVAVGPDAVYFANSTGVFVTTGGPPVCISHELDPWFRAGSYGNLPSLAMGESVTLAFFNNSLYVNDGTNQTTLVYDTLSKAWSVWTMGATAVFSAPGFSSLPNLYFGDDATLKVAKMNTAVTTDNSVAIATRWQSGFYELAPGLEAFTRWTRVTGSGTPTLDVYTDEATSDPLSRGAAVTLGTAPAVAEGFHQKSYNGRRFSHRFSGTSPWSVSSLTHEIAHAR